MTQNKIQDYVDNNMRLEERQDFEKELSENPRLREEVEQLQTLMASLNKIRINKKLLKAKQEAASINKNDRIFKALLGALGILLIGGFVKTLVNNKNEVPPHIQQETPHTQFNNDTIAQPIKTMDILIEKQFEHGTPFDKQNNDNSKRKKPASPPKPIASIEKTVQDKTSTIFRSADVAKENPSPFIDYPDFVSPSEALRDSCTGSICSVIYLLNENKTDSALVLIKKIEDFRIKNILQGTTHLLKGEYKSARQVFNRVNFDETDLPVLQGLAWSYRMLGDEKSSVYYFEIIEGLKVKRKH